MLGGDHPRERMANRALGGWASLPSLDAHLGPGVMRNPVHT
jgi:hypothetical protein